MDDFAFDAKTGLRLGALVNGYVVAVSVALGMIPLVADKFFIQLPDLAAKFFSNGILLGTFSAVLLNVVMNAREGATSSSQQLHAAH